MPSTYTDNLRLTKQGDNDNPNTWGQITNEQVIELIDEAIAGVVQLDVTGSSNVDISSSVVSGGSDVARHAVIELTGTIGADITVIVPSVEKIYVFRGAYTGSNTVSVRCAGGSTSIVIPQGRVVPVYTRGVQIYEVGTNALRPSNNLSDVENAATSRDNLGLTIGEDVQAYNAALDNLSVNSILGLIVQTATGNYTSRTITGGGNVTVTNGDGVGGNPTIAVPDASETVKGVVRFATTLEAQDGTSNTLAMSPAGTKAAFGFTKFFDSGEVDWVAGTLLEVPHNLGATPVFAICTLVCTSAIAGYAVGDEIPLTNFMAANSGGRTFGYNATNVFATLRLNSYGNAMGAKTPTGASAGGFSPVPANWKLRFKAWV